MGTDASGATLALIWQASCCSRSEKKDAVPTPRGRTLAEAQRYRKMGWNVLKGERGAGGRRVRLHTNGV